MFLGHSTGVAALAERAAGQMGLSADDTRSLRRAALLHDIGRLGVPNSIWMRPGRLDWGEMERVRLHAYYTERVLSPISVLGPVAEIAAAAHEHLDGSGYPSSRMARSLLPAARILAAADMAVAMSEARPYRPALSPAAIARELVAEASAGHLDASAVDAVLASLGMKMRVVPRHAHRVSERELEVCRLIAHGKMNKEIADVLGISLRTVQNHVAHIFDKLGVHSRSGVAVWLVENESRLVAADARSLTGSRPWSLVRRSARRRRRFMNDCVAPAVRSVLNGAQRRSPRRRRNRVRLARRDGRRQVACGVPVHMLIWPHLVKFACAPANRARCRCTAPRVVGPRN